MRRYVCDAAAAGCDLVVLPEMWCCPYSNAAFAQYAEPQGGETWCLLRGTARECGVWLVAGSVPERYGDAIYNTCYVFDPQGTQRAKHRKVHLFDIDVAGKVRFMESDTLTAGDSVTIVDTEFCKIGVAICYDVRFPDLFMKMALEGAKLIVLPAAFTYPTGMVHWDLLMRSRAMDNQVYFAGNAPARDENGIFKAYGNSCIVDPWAEFVAHADEKECIIYGDIDLEKEESIRQQLPVLKHRRPELY